MHEELVKKFESWWKDYYKDLISSANSPDDLRRVLGHISQVAKDAYEKGYTEGVGDGAVSMMDRMGIMLERLSQLTKKLKRIEEVKSGGKTGKDRSKRKRRVSAR